jgi:four helix bundle protein
VSIRSFNELEIWQRGVDLVEKIYKITKSFPKDELYGLIGQLRRAAVSIPSNIAEGFARQHNTEYRQFLYVALGSCAELSTQLTIARRLGYIADGEGMALLDELDQVSRMTMSLIKKLS